MAKRCIHFIVLLLQLELEVNYVLNYVTTLGDATYINGTVDFLHQGFIQGGGGDGGLPPLRTPPPPLLNQHKYYKKVVLKHKQQQSDSCCSKKVCTCSKTPRIFPTVYSSCQNIGSRHCFLVGGGRQMVFPPFLKNPV